MVRDEESAAEIHRSKQVLERFALCPRLNQFPQGCQFAFAQRTVELHVKFDPFFAQNMSHEVLGVEARAFDPMFLEIPRGRL